MHVSANAGWPHLAHRLANHFVGLLSSDGPFAYVPVSGTIT